MISSIMTNPFAPLSPTTLLASIKALQATLATCWPRIPSSPWQDEILQSLVTAWLNVHDFDHEPDQQSTSTKSTKPTSTVDPTIAEIRTQLKISASALRAVLRTQTAAEGETASQAPSSQPDPLGELAAPLVSKEPLLAGLFAGGPERLL